MCALLDIVREVEEEVERAYGRKRGKRLWTCPVDESY